LHAFSEEPIDPPEKPFASKIHVFFFDDSYWAGMFFSFFSALQKSFDLTGQSAVI
jgi:hypothetical protein